MSNLELKIRCQRCGEQMEMRDPAPGGEWKPDQFWVCPRCGRHFWTTYASPPKPAGAAEAPAGAKPVAPVAGATPAAKPAAPAAGAAPAAKPAAPATGATPAAKPAEAKPTPPAPAAGTGPGAEGATEPPEKP